GMGREALEAVMPLIRSLPEDTRVWQQYGQALLNMRRFPEAEAALQKAIQLAPNDLQSYNRLGVLYMAWERDADAETAFRHALSLADADQAFWVWEHLGDVLRKQGRSNEAIEAYKAAI